MNTDRNPQITQIIEEEICVICGRLYLCFIWGFKHPGTKKPFRITRNGVFKRGGFCTAQASKDLPQPQLWRAFGFESLKPPPVSASLKSTTVPRRYCALKGSTSTETPWNSPVRSSARFSSNVISYCI